MQNPFTTPEFQARINRRAFLGRSGLGLGGFALANLLYPDLVRAASLNLPGASSGAAASNGRWHATPQSSSR